MKREDERGYADAVWETFRETHRPDRLMESHNEAMLIRRWINANVPLPIVELGIRETTGKPRTLMACELPVQRAYEYYFQGMSGGL
jgi:hypothetical protein